MAVFDVESGIAVHFFSPEVSSMNEKLVLEAVKDWTALNKVINQMNEEEVKAALDIERRHANRKQFIIRLHRRFCMLRNKRERAMLLGETA